MYDKTTALIFFIAVLPFSANAQERASGVVEEPASSATVSRLPDEVGSTTWVFIGFTPSHLYGIGKIEVVRLRWEYWQVSFAKAAVQWAAFGGADIKDRGPGDWSNRTFTYNMGIFGIGGKYNFFKYFETGAIIYPLSTGGAEEYSTKYKDEVIRKTFLHTTVYFRFNYGKMAAEAGVEYPLVWNNAEIDNINTAEPIKVEYSHAVPVPLIYLGLGY